jgi:hypothetical protein
MRYAHTEEMVALRLSDGEDLHEALSLVCQECFIDSAVITSGVGMVREVTFGWYTGSEYLTESRSETFELLALSGNVSYKGQKLYPHLHGVLSRGDHTAVGGHLLRVVVDHNLEVFFRPLQSILLSRDFDGWFEAIVPIRRE